MRRVSAFVLTAMLLSAGRAEAVTVKDIIDLSRAGLGDVVLLALIEVDGGVFTIDKAALTSLKTAGVSDRVIEAMIRSGRTRPSESPAAPDASAVRDPQQPQVIVIEHERPPVQEAPVREVLVQQVVVPVPIYVPVTTRIRSRSHATQPVMEFPRGFGGSVPGFVPVQPQVPPPPKRAEPVYWGWGGKLRPDAWKPAPEIKR